MNLRKTLILAALAVGAATFFALGLDRYLELADLKERQATLTVYTQTYPFRTAGLFFLGYVGLTAVSFPGAAVMTLAAGALFGLGWGTLIVSFASSLGATLAFLLARYLFRDSVARRFGPSLRRIDAGIARDGGFYLFTLRLVPLFPFFVINLAMGLTAMRAWPFYWISQLGMLAGTLVYVNAGTQLARIESLNGIVAPPLLLSFVVLGLFPLAARKIVDLIQRRRRLRAYPKPRRFDANLVVIGAGSGGLVSAYLGATLRAKTVLIEKHRMGGDCLNTGCVPSKALLRSARIAAYLRRAEEFGLAPVTPQPEFREVMARVRRVRQTIEPHDSVARYTALGVECLYGEAHIRTPYTVEVNGREITTRNIIVATGGKPKVPEIPGLSDAPFVTSETLWDLERLPERLLVLGGGPIGCELGQAFARLGSKVTLLDLAPRLLPREDADVATLIESRFSSEGIVLRLGWRPLRIVREGGAWRMIAERDGAEQALPFDRLLLAVGRAANTENLGLDDLPVAMNSDGTIEVDDYLRTSIPNIYAVGDVIGHYQFTHTAAHQAYYAVVNALFGQFRSSRVDYSTIPWVTFTDPEVAHVGLNEQTAQQQGTAYEVTRYGLDDLDRAIAEEEAHGFVKVLTIPGRDRILGVTIVGHHAGESLAEFVLAMRQGLGMNKILGTIHAYPTLAEANKYAAGAWRRNHASAAVLRLLERYQTWRRGC